MSKIGIAKSWLLAAALTSGAALAQSEPRNPSPIAGRVELGVSIVEQDLVARGYRASKIIGAKVYNEQNEHIGKVGDLIVAPDGTLSFAVIDVGGFLGLGEHHVAIPVSHFRGLGDKVVLPGATKAALKELPVFAYAKKNERG